VLIPQFLAAGILISVMMLLVVCALKWLLMGVYKPMMRPMWSWFCLRSEAIAVAYSTMASRVLMDHLHGTPMLAWCMRLFGAKVGEGTYWATTDITEIRLHRCRRFLRHQRSLGPADASLRGSP